MKYECHRTDFHDIMNRTPTPNYINIRRAVLLIVTDKRTDGQKDVRADGQTWCTIKVYGATECPIIQGTFTFKGLKVIL